MLPYAIGDQQHQRLTDRRSDLNQPVSNKTIFKLQLLCDHVACNAIILFHADAQVDFVTVVTAHSCTVLTAFCMTCLHDAGEA